MGFVVALVFAVLAYLFYIAAVALIAGSLGYTVAVGLLMAIGMNMNFIVWLIGIVAGIALAVVVLKFNVQKWVIIIGTGILGAGVILGSFMLDVRPGSPGVLENPVKVVLKSVAVPDDPVPRRRGHRHHLAVQDIQPIQGGVLQPLGFTRNWGVALRESVPGQMQALP